MNRKLNINQIEEIKAKLLNNITVTEISEEYGYSHPSAFIKGLRSVGFKVTKTLQSI